MAAMCAVRLWVHPSQFPRKLKRDDLFSYKKMPPVQAFKSESSQLAAAAARRVARLGPPEDLAVADVVGLRIPTASCVQAAQLDRAPRARQGAPYGCTLCDMDK